MNESKINKIVILGPAHPFRGGIASFNQRFAQELQAMGKEVIIYTYTTQYPKWLFPGKDQMSHEPAPRDLVIHRQYSTINPLSWKTTIDDIIALDPDLIISRFWLPYASVSTNYIHKQLARHSAIRQVSIVDNLIPHQSMPGDSKIIGQFLSSLDQFVCLSQGVHNDLLAKKPHAHTTVLPHPIYDHYGPQVDRIDAAAALGIDPDFRYMLFFGFIKPYKGLDLLLESLDKSFLENHRIKFLIAGDVYGSPKPYDDIIQKKDLADSIIFHKRYIPDDQIAHYFSVADLVVQPYRTATQSGISQIALHFEKPVLVTDVGSLSDFVKDKKTGYVVSPDPESIKKAIIDHFNSADSDKMIDQIRSWKQQFSWKDFSEEFLDFVTA